jgi:hypothetical protein
VSGNGEKMGHQNAKSSALYILITMDMDGMDGMDKVDAMIRQTLIG